MKKIILLGLLFLCHAPIRATVFSVSNDPNGGAQYNTIVDAYNAATNGDTLYLEGTDIDYQISDVSNPWSKALVVVGIGIRPVKSSMRRTKITGIGNGLFFMNPAGSGSRFYGLQFQTPNSFSGIISQVVYENCEFLANYEFSNMDFNNFSFRNCWFTHLNLGGGSYYNAMFSSCIFNGFINGASNGFVSNIIFDHCLFLSTGMLTSGIKNTTISNSIFMNCSDLGLFTNCFILNNIARLPNLFPPSGTAVTFGGNIDNTDPMLVNCPINTGFSSNDPRDYHLLPGSPCIGAGTVGSDIGPHGSLTKFSETGEVLFTPIMRTLLINNTTVVPNGTLNVHIYSTKPNDH